MTAVDVAAAAADDAVAAELAEPAQPDVVVQAKTEAELAAGPLPIEPGLRPAELDEAPLAKGKDVEDEHLPAGAPALPQLTEAEEAAAEDTPAGETVVVEVALALPSKAEAHAVVEAGSTVVAAEGEEVVKDADTK